jgi:enolase
MVKISKIHAREILDSRGNPTVEVELSTESGLFARSAVPSGASTGEHEAIELRDGDKDRYYGKGVLKAVGNINKVMAGHILGQPLGNQEDFDQLLLDLDGTENKSKLGANAILACSMAYARLSAQELNKPLFKYFGGSTLPVPMMNVINGGAHADSGLEIQEFMIIPANFVTFKERLQAGSEIFQALKSLLKADGYTTSVGDEGGFAPRLEKNHQALDYIVKAIEKAGYKPGDQIQIALDVAASEFFEDGVYKIEGESRTAQDMIAMYEELCAKYPIVSIEDGLDENDWDGWAEMTAVLGDKIQIVGDDFLVTNPKRLEKAIEKKAANAILIKLNQIGTVSETVQAIQMAQTAGWNCIVSHRSGETCDTFIADFVVGTNAGQIKTGSLSRSERVGKYNQLLRIEEMH